MMRAASTQKAIGSGSRVNFDSEEGPQAGVVECIKPDLGNGQRIAVVRVEGTLAGAPWQVPLDQLHAVGARS